MVRRLPLYDPDEDGPWETSKRRLQILKRVYQNYYHWQSLREAGKVDDVLVIEGEDVYISDLLVGLDTLPRQQRRAFELICLRGYTESAATQQILPNSNWSTPVQQYSDDGLKKMVAAYDAKQAGTWDPEAVRKRRRTPREKDVVTAATSTPEVLEDTVQEPEQAKSKSRKPNWDFTTWNEDHASLAEYINAKTSPSLEITPAQVKAVAFLRKEWFTSPEHTAARDRRKAARDEEKAKFANETPEQRKARHLAARAQKAYENAQERARKELERVQDLRRKAGLDPETGEPVANPTA